MSNVCVIFDLDGTLVDSETLGTEALLELVPDLNEPLETLIDAYRGQRMATILADVERRLNRKLPKDFEHHYRDHASARMQTHLQPMPGVVEMLQELTYPLAVASSAPPAKIQLALEVCGIDHHFGENVFSCYDINAWKPDPAIFLHTAQAMNVSPGQCIVIEDSDVGVAAALAAGMRVLRYRFPHASSEVIQFPEMHLLPGLLREVSATLI
ncbi:HAD-IA family hydrolase [Blastopirellula marina]|uniref:Haloacid dehalogenase n=1 Tax=Blastopirellula marina TaxID=124 RepID=A0A2S8GE08_9BACT|nr:HAD-IA family hydrolase [Blastopirellula marina]PQO42697.1 haloacid dehalogenase [Blastopirellula marina]PTL46463.1 haloacid dehalogenase [Blastopirellula marina]